MRGGVAKKTEGEGNANASNSRGQQRQDYLIAYMVAMSRKQNATTTTEATRASSSSTQNNVEFHFWNKFVMDRELGEKVGEAWRSSGKLRFLPCPVTKLDTEDLRVWVCPRRWVNNREEAAKSLNIKSAHDTNEEDFVNMDSLDMDEVGNSVDGVSSSSCAFAGGNDQVAAAAGAAAVVKAEPPKPVDEEQAKIVAFRDDPAAEARKISNWTIDTKNLLGKAQGMKYVDNFVEDVKRHKTKLDKLANAVDKYVNGEHAGGDGVKQLLGVINALSNKHTDLKS